MKILAVDTSTKFLCLALADNDKAYAYNLDLGRKLSSLLPVTIKRVLESLDWKAGDINYFACGLGPGSFTGLRVGLATIKGLAWALNKPVAGIPTLDLLALNASSFGNRYIVPVIDAKRNLIYSAIYETKGAELKKVTPYMLLAPDELLKKIKPGSLILGDALSLYKDKFMQSQKKLEPKDKDYWYPRALNLIALAKDKIKKGEKLSGYDFKPIYIYPKECQIKEAPRYKLVQASK